MQLDPPDSVILKSLFKEFDQSASKMFPQYRVIRWLATFLSNLDPGLKKTLTNFQKLPRKGRVLVGEDEEITYIARLKELAGMKAKIEYVVGLGVIKLDVLDGKKFPKEDLIRFAHDADILVDLVVGKETEAAGDQPFKIDAAKLGSILSMNCNVSGELQFQKVAETGNPEANIDRYDVKGGRLSLTEENGENGVATPKPGSYLKYDRQKHMVTEGEIEWNIESQWKSTDHIFFEAEELRGIKVKSVYRAVNLTE